MAFSFRQGWQRLKRFFRLSIENPSVSTYDALLALQTYDNQAGVTVNVEKTIGHSAMWRALTILGETIGSLPKDIIEELETGDIEINRDHPIAPVLNVQPSPLYTAFDFFSALVINACLYGNGLAYIKRAGVSGRIKSLVILDPTKVRFIIDGEDIFYRVDEANVTYRADQIIHIKNLSVSGQAGQNVIRIHRETIGLALANRDYMSNYYGKGAHVSLVLKHPDKLSEEAYKRVRTSWESRHQGVQGEKTAILEEGMDIKDVGNSPKDAMSIDASRISVEDVSRITGIPVHMLMNLERATFNNIEQLFQEFGMLTIRPWAKRIEQEFNRKIFKTREIGRVKVRLNLDAILRADLKTRYDAYATAIQWGWMSRNEVRKMEKQNRAEGLDEFLVPQNMASIGEDGEIIPNNQPDNNSEVQNGLTRLKITLQ